MSIKVKIVKNGKRAKRKERDGLLKGLRDAGEHLLQVANELVPLEEGTLLRSGAVTVAKGGFLRGGPSAAVSYDTVYAVRQHEELTWRHAPGRQAKYLEEPFYAEATTMQELIAAAISKELNRP